MDDLEKPFAMGRTAEIYSYGEGKILKLFFPSIPPSWIDREAAIGQYIQAAHLPVPKFFGRLKEKGRDGLVYERVDGPSMLNQVGRAPWKAGSYARLLARLQAQVHQASAPPDLETQKEWARGGMPDSDKLSKDKKEKVLRLLDSMPEGDRLCHGDFHPGNIVMTARGPVIIDWMTSSRGTVCGDVARTSIILEAAQPPEGTPMRWLLEWVRRSFLGTYLKTYSQLQPLEQASLTAWRTVMAANFFVDVSLPGEGANLLAIVENGIQSISS
jgi:Ser/Thr protein kinase RdoA (MazF antagonist)